MIFFSEIFYYCYFVASIFVFPYLMFCISINLQNRILSFQVWFFKHLSGFGLTSCKEDIFISKPRIAIFFTTDADFLSVQLCSFRYFFLFSRTPLVFIYSYLHHTFWVYIRSRVDIGLWNSFILKGFHSISEFQQKR